jgi:hypothetical protein
MMNNKFWSPEAARPDLLADHLVQMRKQLLKTQPTRLATSTGTSFYPNQQAGGEFLFQLWEKDVAFSYPELIGWDKQSGKELASGSQALLLYYFSTSDGTSPSGQWVSFSELLNGRFYNQAFQGYTGGKLAQVFQNNFENFCQAAESQGGHRVHLLGDAAYEYNVLPMVNLLVVTWQGDEDFDATYQVLFDAAVNHHLPTDAAAITASILTGHLVAGLEKINENRN